MTIQSLPIQLHSFPTPNGKKITVMLEELGVPYDHHLVHIGRDDQFKPEFLAISPNNKIPAIIDPEGPGGEPISIFESGAIMKYLALKFDQFYPTDPRQQVRVDEWLFWQMAGFGPMLGQANHFVKFAKEKVPYGIERYTSEAQRLFGVLDRQLDGNDYIAGDVSIADFATIAWSDGYATYGIELNEFPHFAAWNQRMHARAGTQRGIDAIKL